MSITNYTEPFLILPSYMKFHKRNTKKCFLMQVSHDGSGEKVETLLPFSEHKRLRIKDTNISKPKKAWNKKCETMFI